MKKQTQDEEFIKASLEVKERVVRIMDAGDTALKTGKEIGSVELPLSVLRKLSEDDLPGVISDLHQLPEPREFEYKGWKTTYEKGLNELLLGQSYYIEYLEGGEDLETAMAGDRASLHFTIALRLIDLVHNVVGRW